MCIGLCIRGACCCCTACCNDTCKLIKTKYKLTIKQQVRIAYVFTSLCSILVTIFLMYKAPSTLGIWSAFIHCPEASGGDMTCLGISAVYRISAILVALYALLFLVCLMRDECAKFLNENFWCMKIFIIAGGFVGLMFVDNNFFVTYAEVSKYIGGCFLLFQIVMMIDLFYIIGEKMKKKYDEGYNFMAIILILTSLIFYALTIYFNIKNFQWFPCSQTINIINVVLITVITLLVVRGYFPNGSLVTSGAMSLYLTYQIWSGLNNTLEPECNLIEDKGAAMQFEVFFGVFFIFCALIYISVCNYGEGGQISKNPVLLDNVNKDSDEDDRDFIEEYEGYSSDEEEQKQQELRNLQDIQKQNQKKYKRSKRLKDYQSNSYLAFHFVMILCSFYIAMVLTNWGAPVINDTKFSLHKPNNAAKVINITCSYASWFVYIWTLVAPVIFPDRDFSGN